MKSVRARFSKTDDAKFISHLDLNRTMTFSIRRAGLPVWYTEGFSPHVYITFAMALPVGTESKSEFMDFRLTDDDFNLEEAVRLLNESLPDSIRVQEIYEPVMKPSDIGFARYIISCGADFDEETLKSFFAQDEIFTDKPVSKKKRRKGSAQSERVEIKSGIKEVSIISDLKGFELLLPCAENGSIAPKLIISALSEYTGKEFLPEKTLRCGLFNKEMEIFR